MDVWAWAVSQSNRWTEAALLKRVRSKRACAASCCLNLYRENKVLVQISARSWVWYHNQITSWSNWVCKLATWRLRNSCPGYRWAASVLAWLIGRQNEAFHTAMGFDLWVCGSGNLSDSVSASAGNDNRNACTEDLLVVRESASDFESHGFRHYGALQRELSARLSKTVVHFVWSCHSGSIVHHYHVRLNCAPRSGSSRVAENVHIRACISYFGSCSCVGVG